jgi:putative oxidoreductase
MNPMDTSVVTTDREVNTTPAAMHHDPASARREIAAWEALHREERQAIEQRHAHFYAAGRVLVGALFIVMALDKLLSFNDTVSAVAGTGYAGAPLLVGFALSLELVAGALLALGWNARIAAGWLSIYLVTVTIMFNSDQGLPVNRAIALANLGFVAALLMVTAHGAGVASLEKALARRREKRDLLAEHPVERRPQSVH